MFSDIDGLLIIKIYLIIDESGAKGRSASDENNEREFGVMTGFMIPESHIETWRQSTKKIFLPNKSSNGKQHINSFTKETQNHLRECLYNAFITSGVNWFYQAIYVQGFNEGAFSGNDLMHAKLYLPQIPR